MMGAVELLVLSLGLSVVVAAAGLAGGTLIERMSADPRLRDRAWGAALMLPLTPPLATVLLLMTPPPVREVAMTMAPPLTTGPALTVATTAPVEAAALTLDTGWIALAVLAMAGALVLTRLTLLAHRARRLSALLRTGGTADADTLGLVQDAARHLAIRPPVVMMSAATAEPLLAGLRSVRLVLPQDLPATDTVRRAVILHELAHLKRGDHRVLWLEEAVLALLAANPLMPLLRARRAAAREEACDAVALAGAGTETRRAYAQSLIEALRTRAGSQTVGALPALTFTGAGRTTAMHRLKAVLSPAAPANRRARIGALMTGVVGLALVGAGSAALAAQREPVVQERIEYSATARFTPDVRELLNGQPMPAGLPAWALSPRQVVITPESEGANEVNFILPFNGRAPVSVDGHRMPEGFPAEGINPEAVASVERQGDHVMVTLKSGPELDDASLSADSVSYIGSTVEGRGAERAGSRPVVAWMPVSFGGNLELHSGDLVHVTLTDASGAQLAEALSNGRDVRIPLTEAEFPGLGQGSRAYTLNATVKRADGTVKAADEPVTVRLGPGSQQTARNLSAELSFGG